MKQTLEEAMRARHENARARNGVTRPLEGCVEIVFPQIGETPKFVLEIKGDTVDITVDPCVEIEEYPIEKELEVEPETESGTKPVKSRKSGKAKG